MVKMILLNTFFTFMVYSQLLPVSFIIMFAFAVQKWLWSWKNWSNSA